MGEEVIPPKGLLLFDQFSSLLRPLLRSEHQFLVVELYDLFLEVDLIEIKFPFLFVVGGLDPDFTIDDIDLLVSIIQSLGIKYITKNLYADTSVKDSIYWGRGWMWDDNPDPGAPYLSALNINDNAIEVFVDGTEVDSAALITLDPNTGYLTIENNCKTVASSGPNDLEIIRDWQNNKNTIIVNGKVRQGEIIDSSEHSEKLNLLEPDKYFLTLFKEHLEENGVEVKGDIKIENLPDNSVYLSSIRRSIDTVLTNINK